MAGNLEEIDGDAAVKAIILFSGGFSFIVFCVGGFIRWLKRFWRRIDPEGENTVAHFNRLIKAIKPTPVERVDAWFQWFSGPDFKQYTFGLINGYGRERYCIRGTIKLLRERWARGAICREGCGRGCLYGRQTVQLDVISGNFIAYK